MAKKKRKEAQNVEDDDDEDEDYELDASVIEPNVKIEEIELKLETAEEETEEEEGSEEILSASETRFWARPSANVKMNNEETIRLIKEYRKMKLLWDPDHPDHFNKRCKEEAWDEISGETGRTPEQCKRKMESLLSSLRREKVKMIKRRTRLGRGEDDVYKSGWFAFDSMKFLWDKNKPRPSSTRSATKNHTATTKQVDSRLEAPVEVEEPSAPPAALRPGNSICNNVSDAMSRPPQPAFKRRKLRMSPSPSCDDRRLDRAIETLTATASQIDDESHHFGKVVACKLRAYDENVRCAIQNDILSVFLMASRGCYSDDNASNATFPSRGRGGQRALRPDRPPTSCLSQFSTSSLSSPNQGDRSPDDAQARTHLPLSPSKSALSDDASFQDLL